MQYFCLLITIPWSYRGSKGILYSYYLRSSQSHTSPSTTLHLLKCFHTAAIFLTLNSYESHKFTFIWYRRQAELHVDIEQHCTYWMHHNGSEPTRAQSLVQVDLKITNSTAGSVALLLIPIKLCLPRALQCLWNLSLTSFKLLPAFWTKFNPVSIAASRFPTKENASSFSLINTCLHRVFNTSFCTALVHDLPPISPYGYALGWTLHSSNLCCFVLMSVCQNSFLFSIQTKNYKSQP